MLPADELIDRVVEKLNARYAFEYFSADEIPELLRDEPEEGHPDWYCWRIRRIDHAPWLDVWEARLQKPLPPTFRSLVRRYAFLEFELGPILMFENTGRLRPFGMDLFQRAGSDPALQEMLVPAGYIHFARQWNGDYDPVCFDTNRGGNHEYPVVQIDHEEILCNSRLKVVAELAPSFRRIAEQYLEERE